ncbi:MAG: hypothetical protein ACQETQ_05995 [Spirochaetota bacterium]
MSEQKPLHIFHVARKDGTSLFLHPFLDEQRVMERLESFPLEGLYGSEPRVEALTQFRNQLYRLIEDKVREWMAESRFIPRFLIAAGVFLVAFVVLSVAVRDPLPVIDEIALSLGAAFAAFLMRRRRDMRSDEASTKRMKLRSKVDGIVFSESEFVKRLEGLLQEEENSTPDTALDRLLSSGEEEALAGYEEEAAECLSYLRAKFGSKDYKKKAKRILSKDGQGLSTRDRESFRRWASNKNIDLPLFALYLRLRRRRTKSAK